MKLVSWNVNGLRSILSKGFLNFLEEESPDIICLQETKAMPDQVEVAWPGGYTAHWNPAERRGYAGTMLLTRVKPRSVTLGGVEPTGDREGRVITADYGDFYLVTVYTPNSQRALTRLEYRTRVWDPAFLAYLQRLETKKPVVFCGDMNVAHREIDLARPKENVRNAGFTPEERASFDRIVAAGFLDTFREFESGGGHYTWWSYQNGARERNIGWRIDYFGISPSLRPQLRSAFIRCETPGSDHCPVGIILE